MSGKNKSYITNQNLVEIAKYLIKSHLRMSLSPSDWDKIVKKDVIADRVERRVVVIVGAGASNDIGLPLANRAREILIRDSKMHSDVLDEELNRLSQTYNLERDAFETYLRALSTNVSEAERLRNSLQKIYDKKYMPVMGYEILAHMFKHRFIDAVINFNFDELLDQSISDELDLGEYHYILSDGDCPDENKLREMYPELPFYIKPHGTASHKSTLRFTREDYYGVPLDIQRVLKYLLTEKPVVLITIGFSMQSLEFLRILEDVKSDSKIFHINPKMPDFNERISERFVSNKLIRITPGKKTFSNVIQEVWNIVSESFKPKYRPRNIVRHALVANTFSTNKINEQNIENYLRGRTIVELCLSIAKGKGLVTISRLLEDRSGKYFDFYKSINPDANFYELCKILGLKDIGYSREAMRLDPVSATKSTKRSNDKNNSNILSILDFKNQINFLFSHVQDNLDPKIRNQLIKTEFRNTLIKLYNGQEVEIRYPPSSPYTRIFRFPKPIPTYTTFKFYTEDLFKHDWTYMLIVAETGQWLNDRYVVKQIKDKYKLNKDIKIFMIVADASRKKELTRNYGKIIAAIKELPWWEHNRHMTILVNKNQTPFSSIYFSRRLRSASVIPVLLDNIDDSLIALESFNAYWLKQAFFKSGGWINAADAQSFDKLFKFIKDNIQQNP